MGRVTEEAVNLILAKLGGKSCKSSERILIAEGPLRLGKREQLAVTSRHRNGGVTYFDSAVIAEALTSYFDQLGDHRYNRLRKAFVAVLRSGEQTVTVSQIVEELERLGANPAKGEPAYYAL